jgi:thioredoxin 1
LLVTKVDVDSNPETAMKFGIRNIPTILFFKGGEVVDKHVGAAPKSALATKVDALL